MNLLDMGRAGEALSICDGLIDNGHDTADTYYFKGMAEYALDSLRQAKRSLETAADRAPANEQIRETLDRVSGALGEGDNRAVKRPIEAVPLPQRLSRKIDALSCPVEQDAYGAVHHYNLMGVSFRRGTDQKWTYYQKISVLDARGITQYGTLSVDFDPHYESVYVNTLVVRDEAGEVVARGDVSDYYVADNKDTLLISQGKTLHIPVPHLAPRHTIEMIVTKEIEERSRLVFVDRPLSKRNPTCLAGVYYLGDPEEIRHKGTHGAEMSLIDGGVAWTLENPPAFKEEPVQGDPTRFLPSVYLSDGRLEWEQIGEEYLERIKETLTPDEETRALAMKLTEGASSPGEKLRRLVDHVQSDYTYKGILFGTHAMIPNAASETITRRYGDCKDHSVLLHNLLEAVAIPSHLALVKVWNAIQPDLPSPEQFNHMLVYASTPEGSRFIDVTDKSIDPGIAVPLGITGGHAFVLEPEGIRFVTPPSSRKEDARIRIRRDVTISGDRSLRVEETGRFNGYAAAFIRSWIKAVNVPELETWGQKAVSSNVQAAVVKEVTVTNLDDNREELIVKIVYEVNDGVRKIGGRCFVELPATWEATFYLAIPVDARTTPFRILYPFDMESTTGIVAPEGFVLDPDSLISDGGEAPWSTWEATISGAAGRYELTSRCSLKTGDFEAARYASYQEMMEAVVQSVRRDLSFQAGGE